MSGQSLGMNALQTFEFTQRDGTTPLRQTTNLMRPA